MAKLSQEYILRLTFSDMLDREALLNAKCIEYASEINNKELSDMFEEYKKVSLEHINIMKDKMIKLNIHG